MNKKEFWTLYNQYCRMNATANFSVKDRPLSGDHGCFEVAVFENKEGKWCKETTIERSNNSHHVEYDSEEECLLNLLRQYRWQFEEHGMPKAILDKLLNK